MCGEPGQHVGLNIVWREVANAFCEFESAHSRVGHDLEQDRLRRAWRMRIIRIALKPQEFVARVGDHLKRSTAHRRGAASLRGQRSPNRHDALSRYLDGGRIRM